MWRPLRLRSISTILGTLCLAGSVEARADDGGPPPAPIWTGVYAGLHGGGAWANVSYTFDTFIGPEGFRHDGASWAGGAHIGAQYQLGRLVAGAEAGYTAFSISDTAESRLLPGRFRDIGIDGLFTIAARIGLAHDTWLAYLKAGLASADVHTRVYVAGSAGSSTQGRETGWLFGAGLEMLCGGGLILGIGYDFVRLDIADRAGALPDRKPFVYSGIDDSIHLVTARLTYRFTWDDPPAHDPMK